MKNIGHLIQVLILILICPLSSIAQHREFPMQVLYEIICIPDSTEMDKFHREIAELLVNDSSAVFRSMDKSIQAKAHYEAMQLGIIPSPRQGTIFDFEIVLNGTDVLFLGPMTRRKNEVQYAFGYTDDIRIFDWVLHDEIMVLLGYDCQKATLDYGGRQWEAWFSPDIPVNYGPFKFGNLGGLILKMEDSSGEWVFNAQSINSDPKRTSYFMLAFDKRAQIELFDRNSYYENKKKYFETATDRAIAQGLKFRSKESEEHSRETFRRIYYKNSNWIEFGDDRTTQRLR